MSIFKVPTTTSGVPLSHILTNLNALLDANADRKLGKSPKHTDSEQLKTPNTEYLLTD